MALIDVDSVANFGVNKDQKPYTLDPRVWDTSLNVRFEDGKARPMRRLEVLDNSMSQDPIFAIQLKTADGFPWVWASETDLFYWVDGDSVNVTRSEANGGAYSTADRNDWNGINFGGIPVLTNGAQDPQVWLTPPTGRFHDLDEWPAGYRCKIIRSLGPHLVALNIRDSGSWYPHRVLWSHPADPGTLPASWDITDPTMDAGETELSDVEAGEIVEALPLRGELIIYKEKATHRMRFAGGRFIFDFDSLFETVGALSGKCATVVADGMRHFVATEDDVIVHDGQTFQSVLTRRAQKHVFDNINRDAIRHAFTFTDKEHNECWFCYPGQGDSWPRFAIIWNSKEGTLTEADVDFRGVGRGLETAGSASWEDMDEETWQEATETWALGSRKRPLVFTEHDLSLLDAGTPRSTLLRREGVALLGQKRDRSLIVDHNARKLVTRIWPRLTGDTIRVRLGSQEFVQAPVDWNMRDTFDPEQAEWVDQIANGRAIAVEFSSTEEDWILEGYKLDLSVTGSY